MSGKNEREVSHTLLFLDDDNFRDGRGCQPEVAKAVIVGSRGGSSLLLKLPRDKALLEQVRQALRDTWSVAYREAQSDIREALGVKNCDCDGDCR